MQVKGWCAVYTDIFCTHNEFRAMFDHSLVDASRIRLHAHDAFPDIYTKVKPEAGIADLAQELQQEAAEGNGQLSSRIAAAAPPPAAGAQVACFTRRKVQILTQKLARQRTSVRSLTQWPHQKLHDWGS